MTRFLKHLAAIAPMLAACFAFGEITGSKHDFSAAGWSDNQICKPCHTPHNADVSMTGRLWAHTMSTATYRYHGGSISDPNLNDNSLSPDAGATTLSQTDFDAGSRLCLSCHDGTVALDSFMGKDTTMSTGNFIGQGAGTGDPTANLSGSGPGRTSAIPDLSNDHPVGFRAVYREGIGMNFSDPTNPTGHARYKPYSVPSGRGMKFAFAPATYNGGNNLIGEGRNQTGALIGTYTISGRAYTTYPSISCVTCHNVHNSGATDEPGMLRYTNVGSALCLSCHNK